MINRILFRLLIFISFWLMFPFWILTGKNAFDVIENLQPELKE